MSDLSQGMPPTLDRGQVDDLFRAHADWLLGVLQRQMPPETAEDIVQETYLKMVVSQGAAQPLQRPRAFLMRIARNLIIDRYRRAQVRPQYASLENVEPAVDADQFDVARLKVAVLGLPRPLLDVLLLSRLAGWKTDVIARHLGIPRHRVEARLARALIRIRHRLDD